MSGVIEDVARANRASGGFDPDEIMSNDAPRWRYYVPGAEATIRTILSGPVGEVLREAMTHAYHDYPSDNGIILSAVEALPSEITNMLWQDGSS